MKDMMLVVDDVEINREILKVIFKNQYEILEAENGEEALAMIEGCQGSIDIILLDLMMEGLSGFDILEERKKIDFFRKIPVVVITSSGYMEDQIKAFDMGANEYIAKPFVPELVLSRVNNVMSSAKRMHMIEFEAEKMKMKSEQDEMTGLLNKTTAEYHMNKVLAMSDNCLEVMIVIDVDNFKAVNDTSGHQEGDYVLKTVAKLISNLFRKSDIVGRIGGDEFCVLMVDIEDMENARVKVGELIQAMRIKSDLKIPEYVTLSIGMASNEKQKTSYAELFQKADSALYEAKLDGKAQYHEYGMETITLQQDSRPVTVIVSNNRMVCSTIHALIPTYIQIVEVSFLSDLENLSRENRSRACMLYADVSEYKEDLKDFFQNLQKLDWMKIENVFAICEEGNTIQYLAALESGIADMFTTPIDRDAFKRRMIRQLEKMGLIK